jgi:hypothetical protein
MRDRFSGLITACAVAAVGFGAATPASLTSASDQVSAVPGAVSAPAGALKTPWGEPDLQGIWTDEFDTPLQRPAKYADQEFFTEAR